MEKLFISFIHKFTKQRYIKVYSSRWTGLDGKPSLVDVTRLKIAGDKIYAHFYVGNLHDTMVYRHVNPNGTFSAINPPKLDDEFYWVPYFHDDQKISANTQISPLQR